MINLRLLNHSAASSTRSEHTPNLSLPDFVASDRFLGNIGASLNLGDDEEAPEEDHLEIEESRYISEDVATAEA